MHRSIHTVGVFSSTQFKEAIIRLSSVRWGRGKCDRWIRWAGQFDHHRHRHYHLMITGYCCPVKAITVATEIKFHLKGKFNRTSLKSFSLVNQTTTIQSKDSFIFLLNLCRGVDSL